ncbi:Exoenzyme S synthesis regulatory protein ExsA [compost metagenome]
MHTVARQEEWNRSSAMALREALIAQFARSAPVNVDRATEIPWLRLYGRNMCTSPHSFLYEPEVAVILQGSKEVIVGDEKFVYDEERFLLTAINLPVVSYVTDASEEKPFMALIVRLDLARIRQLIMDYDIPAPKVASIARGIGTAPVTLDLLRVLSRLFELLDAPRHIPVLSGLLYQEIIYHLLDSEQGGRLWQLAMTGSQSNRIQKVINWLRHHYAEPFSVDDLAGMAAMSVSSMRQHFHDITSMSPLQFQKQLRLQEARRLMLVEGLDAGMAAFQVGYESASQFSREYHRQFGLPPMRDIKQLRDAAQAFGTSPDGEWSA